MRKHIDKECIKKYNHDTRNRTNVRVGKRINRKEGFSMERVKVKCGTLHHIKRNTGKVTDCIFAKILHKNIDINLTYDCISGNLVIHEWYKVSKLELNDMMEELKQCFAAMVK